MADNEMEVTGMEELLDLGALAEFATKAKYRSFNNVKKLYEYTVEEARELVKVRDQNKKKKEGIVALGINLGRCLLPLDKIVADATRFVCSDGKAKLVTKSIIAHVKAGLFDEEIANALAQTKATAEKMAATANKKNEIDAEIPVSSNAVPGLDLEALVDTGSDIEQL